MPIDVKLLRDPVEADRWRKMTKERFRDPVLVDRVVDLDAAWRKAQFETEQARKQLGLVQKEIGAKMKAKENADAEKAKKVELDAEIIRLEAASKDLQAQRDKALSEIPNELDPSVPVSNDEKDNAVVKRHGTIRPSTPDLLHHHELLAMIDGYESER